jgi:hypothetical protein
MDVRIELTPEDKLGQDQRREKGGRGRRGGRYLIALRVRWETYGFLF